MELEPTGERLIEEHYRQSAADYLIYLCHRRTYQFALEYMRGARVLDYGCGSGHGSYLLAPAAAEVIGVDVAEEAIGYAQSRYLHPHLRFLQVRPGEALPFADESFDAVISSQVIEHIHEAGRYLGEIRRLLRPGGTLLLATPDRTSRLFPFQKPWNRFHVTEYDAATLNRLLRSDFTDVDLFRMGGAPEVIRIELARTRRMKWLSLPFTLPFIPEAIRIRALGALRRLKSRPSGTSPGAFGFDEAAILIGRDVSPATNLIAIARKAAA